MPPPPVPLHKSSPAAVSPLASTRPEALVPSSPILPSPPPPRRGVRRAPVNVRSNLEELVRQRRRGIERSPVVQRDRRKRQRMSREVERFVRILEKKIQAYISSTSMLRNLARRAPPTNHRKTSKRSRIASLQGKTLLQHKRRRDITNTQLIWPECRLKRQVEMV